MFRNNALKLKFKPTDGSKVLVVGKISVYEATGQLSDLCYRYAGRWGREPLFRV